MVKVKFRVYLLHLLRFYQAYCTLVVRYCYITGVILDNPYATRSKPFEWQTDLYLNCVGPGVSVTIKNVQQQIPCRCRSVKQSNTIVQGVMNTLAVICLPCRNLTRAYVTS